MRNGKKIISKKIAATIMTASLTVSGLGMALVNSPIASATETNENTIIHKDNELENENLTAENTNETSGESFVNNTNSAVLAIPQETPKTELAATTGTTDTVLIGDGGVEIGNGTRVSSAPVVSMSAGSSLTDPSIKQVFPGYKSGIDSDTTTNEVTFICEQKGASSKLGAGFQKFKINMTNPTKNSHSTSASMSSTPRDDVRLNKNKVIVKVKKIDNSVEVVNPSNYVVDYINSDPKEGIYVDFKSSYLSNSTTGMAYNGETYYVEATVKFTDSQAEKTADPSLLLFTVENNGADTGLLKYYERTDGNADIPISVSCSTETNSQHSVTADYPTDSPVFADSRTQNLASTHLYIRNPVLNVSWDCTPTFSNVYGKITYNVYIKNLNKGTTAKGIKVEDIELPNAGLAGLAIVPQNAKVTLNGSTYSLGDDFAITTPTPGKININCGLLTLTNNPPSKIDEAIVSYDIVLGTDAMKTDKSKLRELLALETGIGIAKRKGTITAKNVFTAATTSPADNSNAMHANLLYPQNIQNQASIEGNKTTIGYSETAHVVVQFKGESNVPAKAAQTEIQNAQIIISPLSASSGTISNVKLSVSSTARLTADSVNLQSTKCDKVSYSSGNSINDYLGGAKLTCDDYVILEYDVTAPTTGTGTLDITPVVTFKAENASADVASNTTTIHVVTAEFANSIKVNNQKPSAASIADNHEPVVVEYTVQEQNRSSADNMLIKIIDTYTGAVDPCMSRFNDIKIKIGTGAETPLSSSSYSITGNVLSIPRPTINKNEKIVIKYTDYIPAGYAKNGLKNEITGELWKNDGSTSALKTATTNFVIQTPVPKTTTSIVIPDITVPKTDIPEADLQSNNFLFEETNDNNTNIQNNFVNVGDVLDVQTEFYTTGGIGRDFEAEINIDDIILDTPIPAITGGGTISTLTPSSLGLVFVDSPTETDAKYQTKIMAGDIDVTDQYNITFDVRNGNPAPCCYSKIKITGKDNTNSPNTPIKIYNKLRCGDNDGPEAMYVAWLAGQTIKVSSKLSLSNLELPATSSSEAEVASAIISVKTQVEKNEITFGDTNKYTITVKNDEQNKIPNDYSVARNVTVINKLANNASKKGYAIDENSISAKLDGIELMDRIKTNSSYRYTDDGFSFTIPQELTKNKNLVITYETTTKNIAADSFSETLDNTTVITASNSSPTAGFTTVHFKGKERINAPGNNSGNNNDSGGTTSNEENSGDTRGDGKVSNTGDVIPYLIGGAIVIALIGGAFIIVRRRMNR